MQNTSAQYFINATAYIENVLITFYIIITLITHTH